MKHGDANAKGAWQQPLYDPGRGSIAAPARADYAKKLKRRNSLAAQESPEKGQQLPSTKPLELGQDQTRQLMLAGTTWMPHGWKHPSLKLAKAFNLLWTVDLTGVRWTQTHT